MQYECRFILNNSVITKSFMLTFCAYITLALSQEILELILSLFAFGKIQFMPTAPGGLRWDMIRALWSGVSAISLGIILSRFLKKTEEYSSIKLIVIAISAIYLFSMCFFHSEILTFVELNILNHFIEGSNLYYFIGETLVFLIFPDGTLFYVIIYFIALFLSSVLCFE